MKISTVILSVVFLGAIGRLGPDALRSLEELDRGRPARIETQIRYAGIFDSGPEVSIGLNRLKEREAEVTRGIREVESALRKIESSERYLERRVAELEKARRCRSQRADLSAILEQVRLLEQEKNDYLAFLDRLTNEQATLKVKIDLWTVSSKKDRMRAFIGAGEKGPIEGLSEEAKRRDLRYAARGGIPY
jgi:chromosome segregation ATPase